MRGAKIVSVFRKLLGTRRSQSSPGCAGCQFVPLLLSDTCSVFRWIWGRGVFPMLRALRALKAKGAFGNGVDGIFVSFLLFLFASMKKKRKVFLIMTWGGYAQKALPGK